SATVVRSASRSTVTICSSVNRLFLIGSSWVGSHLPRNHWSGKTGQVNVTSHLADAAMRIERQRAENVDHIVTFLSRPEKKKDLTFRSSP
ncbi:MAG: hypothetical protein Q8K91_04600, partial [Hylemonella sp.]|nr:hypothetical protein [Hylemonella sp.]MDP1936472.1 hypothetical protein [Hylemonella sp.]